MASQLCLVLGGVRSGKSAYVECRAVSLDQVTLYVATGLAIDDEMKERIRPHQESRPPHSPTLEEPLKLVEKLAPVLKGLGSPGTVVPGVVIIDSVDVWVANLLMELQSESKSSIEEKVMAETDKLLALTSVSSQRFIMVSSEVGMSLVPPEPLGRRFQDLLGTVNQRVAAEADRVYLVVAGIPTEIKGPQRC